MVAVRRRKEEFNNWEIANWEISKFPNFKIPKYILNRQIDSFKKG